MSLSKATVFLCTPLLWLITSVTGAAGQDVSAAARKDDFKSFVRDFEASYAYIDRPEKPWLTWEARFGPQIDRADSVQAFDTVLADALSELHDFHAEVRSPVPDRWLPVPTFADIWAEWHGQRAIVTAVRQGSDAEREKILTGDTVIAIGLEPIQTAIQNRLTRAVDQSNPRAREWALLSVLTGRADEERVFTVTSPGQPQRQITLPVQRQFDRQGGLLSSKILPGNVGLVRLNNSLGDQRTVEAFDVALALLKDTRGLILDLRDVPSGGDSSIALGIMGRFVSRVLPFQRHRIPHFGQQDVERNWIELVVPRGPFTYTAPVVVLVDHWTGSMGEGVAVGFDAMQRGVVVGTPMAGLAGAVSDDKLPRTGVDVAFATEQIFHVDGTPRQDWLPRVLVTEVPPEANGDPILANGLKELQAMPKWPKAELWNIHPAQEP